jgi:hypothetical protein
MSMADSELDTISVRNVQFVPPVRSAADRFAFLPRVLALIKLNL